MLDLIIIPVPLYEFLDALFDGDFGGDADGFVKGGAVGAGFGDVSGLDGQKLPIHFAARGRLDGVDEVRELDGTGRSDVVNAVGSGRSARVRVFGAPLRVRCCRLVNHPHQGVDDVVDIGEGAPHLSVVENLDGPSFQDVAREKEHGHVGPAPGAVDGEEAQARGGDLEQVAVGVGHEFAAFLGGRIQADGMVHVLLHGEGQRAVEAVN